MKLAKTGPWDLPIVGFEVLQVTFSYALDIVAYGDGHVTSVLKLGGPFELVDPERGNVQLNASSQSWEDLTAILTLRHERITAVTAADPGTLSVRFSSGRGLRAGPDPQYENWELDGPGFRLICRPGGGVSIWDTDAA